MRRDGLRRLLVQGEREVLGAADQKVAISNVVVRAPGAFCLGSDSLILRRSLYY